MADQKIVDDFYKTLPKKPVTEASDNWLMQRYKLGTVLIRMIQDDPDPRTPDAIARLNEQKQTILDEILRRGLPPPAQSISMKAIDWQVTAPGIGP